MEQLWKDILTSVFMGLILPGMMLGGASVLLEEAPVEAEIIEERISCPVAVRGGETVTRMDLDKYLTGVVLAEMPASFDPEALKAQSIAARTYAVKAAVIGGKHGDGSICTESSCCQGYLTEEAYLSMGGREEGVDKIRAAVEATSGLVLTYEGELIEATYFSSSGGTTEDALAVWGTDFPYLKSVASPGEQTHDRTMTFTPEEFCKALGRNLEGSPESWFTITTYTSGGGVAAMTIGGESYSGTKLRSILGLRSTAFTVDTSSTKITVTTRGYGHRVGMSQYGADAMAVNGSNYAEILAHYYPGTELTDVKDVL
jgi:stage II sporulation protein D